VIDWVVHIKAEHFLSGRIKNDFAEWDAAQLLIFIEQRRDQLDPPPPSALAMPAPSLRSPALLS